MVSLFNSSECFFRVSTRMAHQRITQVSGSFSNQEYCSFIWVANEPLTTNLPPSSGLELVFTDVLICTHVPYMTHLQAWKRVAPFLWWFRCRLAGSGTERLRLGAGGSQQLIPRTRLWLGYHSRGRARRRAISSRCNGERDEGNGGKMSKTTSVHTRVSSV